MHKKIIKPLSNIIFVGLYIATLSGCSVGGSGPDDDDHEGGVIGTGLILKGTVTDVRAFASNTLLIKSRTGEVSRAVIDDSGRFYAPNVSGSPPYLLRADLGNNEFRYGIAFDNEIANIHSYTDVIMRNWFASGNGEIDFEFDQQTFTTALPSRSQYQQNAGAIFSIVRLVLDSYQLTGDVLLTGDYDASNNNYGIHSFLRSNSIFIEDDKIALVITDPLTETQSTTKSEFSVFDMATNADVEPPSEPESVRALPSATDKIVVVWEPAFDNRGVIGYDIYREGNLVATTPYPVFEDTGLEPDLLYTYEIVSIDASNNRSALSLPATSGTLGEPDNTAPPAPVQLSINAKSGRMNLLWGQSNIGDVVGFDVYRGRDNNSLDFLTSVTSSIHADLTVKSGVEYCYQIVAFDATGNESPRSLEVCEMSVGDVVVRLSDESTPSVPLDAGLTISDTQNLECVNQWSSYEIKSSVTVDAGCYLVSDSIDIENGGSLSIAAGAVLKFAAGTGILVGEGGSLASEGSKAMPVLFTAQDPTPGYWNGIEFNNSNSLKNSLVNSVVEFAGGGRREAAVSLRAPVFGEIARLNISGSVIRDCVGTGIQAADIGTNLSKLDGSVITGCDIPLMIDVQGIKNVTQRNRFSQNRNDWIDLGDAEIVSDTTLKSLGVPFLATSIHVVSGKLTVSAGTEIKFREGGWLYVEGSLSALGSETEPVVFTGTLAEPGHWKGIHVRGNAIFKNTELLFAGSDRGILKNASLAVYGGFVELSNLTISSSSSLALFLAEGVSEIKNVDGLTIKNSINTIEISVKKLHQLGRNVVFEDNTNNEIFLSGATVTDSNIDIYHLGVPYSVQDSINMRNGRFSINPGVILIMGDRAVISIDRGSVISAVGDAVNPIVLTHKSSFSGAWQGINISSANPLNRLEYTTVEYAGGGTGASAGAVRLRCSYGSSLFIENSIIQDSAGWGISPDSAEGCDLQFGENVNFFRNRMGDIRNQY